MKLEKEVLYETFETWNFLNPSWGVAYLKLWDETWNVLFETWNFAVETIWNFWCVFQGQKKFQLTLNLGVINLFVHRVDICC